MDDALVGATISAAASIMAALISKPNVPSPRTRSFLHPWISTCSVVGIWFLASPATIHIALVHYNFALIPLTMMSLVWLCPLPPMIAASVTLGLFAVNWAGWRIALAGTGFEASHTQLLIYLLLACASAALVSSLSRWRSKSAKASPAIPPLDPPVMGTCGICTELERLSRLHESGALSNDEFSRGKQVILGHPRRAAAHRSAQLAS